MTIASDAIVYGSAAAQHLRALVKLLGPEIVITGWSVTKALAGYCRRVAWLLNPEATPTGRVARFDMERAVSIHMARMSTDKIGEKAFAKQMRCEREEVLSQARRVSPDIALFNGEELNGWSVGGESYASLGGAVNEFGNRHLGANGLYDTLSSFTLPSLYRLGAQTTETQLGDRVHRAFTATPDLIRWQLAVAGASIYRAAHHVVGYLGTDAAPLKAWADRYPDLLRTTKEETSGTTTEERTSPACLALTTQASTTRRRRLMPARRRQQRLNTSPLDTTQTAARDLPQTSTTPPTIIGTHALTHGSVWLARLKARSGEG